MNRCWGLIALVWVGVLAGCAGLDEGEVDYRKAGPLPSNAGKAYSGQQTVLLPLVNKYDQVSDQALYNTETVSVHLLHGFVKDFYELGTHGEIAVVGRVFELGADNTFDFSPAAVKEQGRLLYYSEDVREGGHHLSFSALPVYGPITYGGSSLMLEFHILELDANDNAKLQGMLKAIASIGAVAYPPASPILAMLEGIGTQLLSGNADDREFRYHFGLHPAGGKDETNYPRLEAGNYVLIKQDAGSGADRPFADTNWSELSYDQNSGKVLVKDGDTWRDFVDATYLVIQINRGLPAVAMDVAQKFSEFEQKLKESVGMEVAALQNLAQSVVSGIIATRHGAEAEKLLIDLKKAADIKDTARQTEVRTRLLGALVPVLKSSLDSGNPTLTPQQKTLYFGMLGRLLKTPLTPQDTQALFSDPDPLAALLGRF